VSRSFLTKSVKLSTYEQSANSETGGARKGEDYAQRL